MFGPIGDHIRRIRRAVSRSDWVARQLHRDEYEARERKSNRPGVLMIQIDGLGYDYFLEAIEKKRLPFLQRLIQRDHFVLRKHYSGLPSTTPAVQAELFFGIRNGVAAFKYFDRIDRREKAMYDAAEVDSLAARFEKRGRGLLNGGSSYSNIFAGGAKEALFCIQTMKLESMFKVFSLKKIIWFALIHLDHLLRIVGLALMEAFIALYDCGKGLIRGRNPFKELKFIASRIGACIIVRELVRLHVKIDIARGLPIIHANFIGYDEHSHRRGPNSAFAFWTLKGIDATIKDIVSRAMRSDSRDYHIFIYSDHGQEDTVPFAFTTGRSLDEAVRDVFSRGPLREAAWAEPESVIPHLKLHQRNRRLLRTPVSSRPSPKGTDETTHRIHITAMGPLGHIYLPAPLADEEMHRYARSLVHEAGIPLVFYICAGTTWCVGERVSGTLEDTADEALGGNHPFIEEIVQDLNRLCRHEHAGDFVISGWRRSGRPLSFPIENGAHGGPGDRETTGFLILPDTLDCIAKPHLRPQEVRRQVQKILENRHRPNLPAVPESGAGPEIIRAMSYNIHSCRGMDGKVFPHRIARIISRQAPDVVALQEVDRHMERTGREDQARLIAERLSMHHRYFPLLETDGGAYGLAILSRFPCNGHGASQLPRTTGYRSTEPRGIMWVRLETRRGPIHLFNTHLSLYRRERLLQMRYIVNDCLPAVVPDGGPVILCGDLNSGSRSPVYSMLARVLSDCQRSHSAMRAAGTFISTHPLLRLDHIFHSSHLASSRYHVINDWECRLASDHLPVLAVIIHDSRIDARPLVNHGTAPAN